MFDSNSFWHILPGVQLSANTAEREPMAIQMVGSTGVLQLVGPTSKFGGMGTTSTIKLRSQIRQLASDDSVQNALLYWDTPGGQVAGTAELTQDIANLARMKPTFGYASDTLASAGYRALSQVGKIYANEAAFVGSIGTASALTDTSGAAEKIGIQVHEVTTGGVKSSGAFGTSVSPEQVQHAQELVNAMQKQFNTDVAQGRNMPVEQVARLADGRLHVAADAVRLGLIDGVASLESTINELQAFTESQTPTSTQKVFAMYGTNPAANGNGVATLATPMQNAQPQPQQPAFVDLRQAAQPQPVAQPQQPAQPPAAQHNQLATIQEIKAACPGCSNDFAVAQLEGNADVQTAVRNWNQLLNTRVTQLESQLAQAQAAPTQQFAPQAPAPQAAPPAAIPPAAPTQFGNQPIYETGQAADSIQQAGLAQQWKNTVDQIQASHLKAGKNPHEAYMEARSTAESLHPGGAEAWNETQQHRPGAGPVQANMIRTR